MPTAYGSLHTPQAGDVVQLLGADNKPSENFTYVDQWMFEYGINLFEIEDCDGEHFIVTRAPEQDNEERLAWQEVVSNLTQGDEP